MEPMASDVGEAALTGQFAAQAPGTIGAELDSSHGFLTGSRPSIRVDGSLTGGSILRAMLTAPEPPKFELESYIANYAGKLGAQIFWVNHYAL